MLNKIGFFAAVLSGSMLVAGPIVAATPALDQREHNQAQRIRQGVKSGELTRPETRRLVRGEAQLRRHEAIAKSDGVVTARERARLRHEADIESRRIYRQKHDAQDRH
jgi:hypothetical protein